MKKKLLWAVGMMVSLGLMGCGQAPQSTQTERSAVESSVVSVTSEKSKPSSSVAEISEISVESSETSVEDLEKSRPILDAPMVGFEVLYSEKTLVPTKKGVVSHEFQYADDEKGTVHYYSGQECQFLSVNDENVKMFLTEHTYVILEAEYFTDITDING